MLITGILITIVAIFMLFPDKLLKNPKMKIILRIWGGIFVIVGILLIVFSTIQ